MNAEVAKVLAVVTLVGFAIQQLLQILDPCVMSVIKRWKIACGSLPGDMSDADFKKAVMATLGMTFGGVTVALTDIRTLFYLNPAWRGVGDFLVTSLAVGSGTEGANTLLKYFGYVKEARKQALDSAVTVEITTPAVAVIQNKQLQFTARVANAPSLVVWEVMEPNGGTINRDSGLYTAPPAPGTYRISATSPFDITRPAVTEVTVV